MHSTVRLRAQGLIRLQFAWRVRLASYLSSDKIMTNKAAELIERRGRSNKMPVTFGNPTQAMPGQEFVSF